LAIQNFHNTNNALPPSGSFPVGGPSVVWSPQSRLFPYLEQNNLAGQISYDNSTTTSTETKATRIAVLVCPSEPKNRGRAAATGVNSWCLNYGVNEGTWAIWSPTNGTGGNGPFTPTIPQRFSTITDGLSNTLAMADVKAFTPRLSGAGNPNSAGAPPPQSAAALVALGGSFSAEGAHAEWQDGKVIQAGFTTTFTPNTKIAYTDAASGGAYDVDLVTANEGNTANQYTYAAVTSRSYHGPLVNVLLMDGSVRPIADSIDRATWQGLSTRDGGESITFP
jgi:hypothetical protein